MSSEKKTTSISLSSGLRERIDQWASELGESRSAFMRTACIQRVERLRMSEPEGEPGES